MDGLMHATKTAPLYTSVSAPRHIGVLLQRGKCPPQHDAQWSQQSQSSGNGAQKSGQSDVWSQSATDCEANREVLSIAMHISLTTREADTAHQS